MVVRKSIAVGLAVSCFLLLVIARFGPYKLDREFQFPPRNLLDRLNYRARAELGDSFYQHLLGTLHDPRFNDGEEE